MTSIPPAVCPDCGKTYVLRSTHREMYHPPRIHPGFPLVPGERVRKEKAARSVRRMSPAQASAWLAANGFDSEAFDAAVRADRADP